MIGRPLKGRSRQLVGVAFRGLKSRRGGTIQGAPLRGAAWSASRLGATAHQVATVCSDRLVGHAEGSAWVQVGRRSGLEAAYVGSRVLMLPNRPSHLPGVLSRRG